MDRLKDAVRSARSSQTTRVGTERSTASAPQPSSSASPSTIRPVHQSNSEPVAVSRKPLPRVPPRAAINTNVQGRSNAAASSSNGPSNGARNNDNTPISPIFRGIDVLPSISLRRSRGVTSDSNNQTVRPTVYHDGHGRAAVTVPELDDSPPDANKFTRAVNVVRGAFGFNPTGKKATVAQPEYRYDPGMVDFLDTIDPEVQTLTSLTNVQNSLFVPDLGKYVNRRPTYSLTSLTKRLTGEKNEGISVHQFEPEQPPPLPKRPEPALPSRPDPARRRDTIATIDSTLSDSRYAVLPHGMNLEGWTKEDKAELNDQVRHMLHSRRSKFKRAMKGFGQYVRRPLGFLVTLYATLITLFGLAWVLFLIGWINVGGKQLYVINVIDNVLVALFAIVGDGLAPFRAVDTYHMIFIARYHHLTWKIREKRRLPALKDHNDLPTEMPVTPRKKYSRKSVRMMHKALSKISPLKRHRFVDDVEEQQPIEYSVLSRKQQERLMHHQAKFAKSHTFYKPHETETHYAFPLRLLVAVVVLLDCHSLFQIALGACTWGIDYRVRPFVLTTVILCCSITCNATAGILIMIGDRRTRKKDVLERMNRQELTEEAVEKLEKKWEKEEQEEKEEAVKQQNGKK